MSIRYPDSLEPNGVQVVRGSNPRVPTINSNKNSRLGNAQPAVFLSKTPKLRLCDPYVTPTQLQPGTGSNVMRC